MKNAVKALVLFGALLGATSYANEIYKWTDEDGNVHYGDRPTGAAAESAETIALASRPTSSTAVRERIDSRLERQEQRAEARSAREEAEQKAAEERKAAEEKAKLCSEYRTRLEKFVTSRRLYKMDDSGERVYLDEAEMQKARSDLQARIEETCSG